MTIKKWCRWLSAAGCAALLLSSLPLSAAAEEVSVVYEGDAQRMIDLPSGNLFPDFSGMMPGQQADQKIAVKNRDQRVIRLYLRAQAADASSFTDEAERERSEELLGRLVLTLTIRTVESGERVIYSGPASGQYRPGEDSLSTAASLGTYQPGAVSEIRAILQVPGSLRNDYQNSLAKVKWIFLCEASEEPPDPEGPTVDIPDYETPLSPPPGIDIPDYDTPLASPVTGESHQPVTAAVTLAAGALCLLLLVRKRRRTAPPA